MKFLCTTCHRVHGLSQAEISECRSWFLEKTPDEKDAAKREMMRRHLDSETSGNARIAESYVRARKAGCPQDALNALLRRSVQDTPALAGAKRWILNPASWSLLLLGPPGVGKTVAACYAMVDFCRRWEWNTGATGTNFEPCLFLVASELARLSVFTAADRERYEQLQETRLLVVDDAGDEVTDFGSKALVDLLMGRHRMKRKTILCANLGTTALTQRYGAALVDRFKEGAVPSLQSQTKSMRQRSGN